MADPRKSTSPFLDALKLFFRNPSAVVALGLIAMLALAAISGNVFTGEKPSTDDWEKLEAASELGDTTDLDINTTAILDPSKTRLKDTFLPPFSKSRMSAEEWQNELIANTPEAEQDTEAFQRELDSVEPRNYVLGTDHLGRDVLARLWAGSTISLTIGFLAVGIAVLLGVSLGGISGFFGRRPVRMPMLIMLLSALIGGIAIPAEAPLAGAVFFAIAIAAFIFQVVVALIGKRHRAVISWAVIAAIVGGIFLYNFVIETTTPEGRILTEARNVASVSKDVLLMTRDHGREVKDSESGIPDALEEDALIRDQMELEVAYDNMYLQEKRFQFMQYAAGLDIYERTGHEQLERAEHLKAHVDESHTDKLSDEEVANLSARESQLRKRHLGWKKQADEGREGGQERLARAAAYGDLIEEWIDAAWEVIDQAEEDMEIAGDFEFDSAEARINKLKENEQALKRVDRAMARAKLAEHLAAALLREEAPKVAIGDKLLAQVEATRDSAAERIESVNESLEDAEGDERESLTSQLAAATREHEQATAALEAARKLDKAGDRLERQFEVLDELAGVKGEGAAMIRKLLPDAIRKAAQELSEESDGEDVAASAAADLNGAAGQLAAISAAEQAVESLEQEADEVIGLVTKPEDELSEDEEEALQGYTEYDYGEKESSRSPVFFALERSVKLLNRRAEMRTEYLKKYEAMASNLFDSSRGILQVTEPDGSRRYGVFRITRHFVSVTIMLVILLVASMIVAAAAQGAAEDIKSPLTKAFIPTISVDDLVMRFTEIMMTIPVIYLILAVLALFERDVYIVMAVIGLTSWMGTTRFVRAEILSLREQDFIQASRALGVSDFRIIWRHLVPNAISPVLVSATLMVATAVLAESTLSFLGIGAGPDQYTWGQILNNGRAYITDASWLTWIPGVAILITVLSFNLLGEGLREAFNPKLRGR